MDAFITIYPLPFGYTSVTPLKMGTTAIQAAADWLSKWKNGNITHENVMINACSVDHDGYSPTGLKTFDEQRLKSSGLTTGNVSSNVQTSTYVDSYHHVEWPVKEKGEFQAHGLRLIRSIQAPGARQIADFIRDCPSVNDPDEPKRQAIAYLLHHYHGPKSDRKRIDHGWIVTDNEGRLLKRMDLSNSQSSQLIMDRAQNIFTHKHALQAPLLKIVNNEVVFVDPQVQEMADRMLNDSNSSGAAERPRSRG